MAAAKLTIAAYRLHQTTSRTLAGAPASRVIDTERNETVSLQNVSLEAPGIYAIDVQFQPLDTETPTGRLPASHGFTSEMAAQVMRAAKDTLKTDETK